VRRYLGQRDHYRCGPVALLNLDKWSGHDVTAGDLRHYEWRCRCRNPQGTSSRNFSRAVGKRGRRLSYAGFKRLIESGGAAVLLTHKPNRRHGHYWFVPGIARRNDGRMGFLAVNFRGKETLTLISWPYMKWLLGHSTVWPFQSRGTGD
jgi:hypothetical protein